MSNYIEYNDKIAFHPGYYIKELVVESGLTQADFAKKLNTTPKNLSVLISGEQSLSIDMATKLSRMMGTSAKYWLNLQQSYDAVRAEILSDEMYSEEKDTYKKMDCDFFVEKYKLGDSGREEDMIKRLREYFKLSSLKVLEDSELSVDFRGYEKNLTKKEIVNTNAIIQGAINVVADTDIPRYSKKKFLHAVDYVVQGVNFSEKQLEDTFCLTGVRFMWLPCMKEAKIDAVSKKIDGKVLFAVNEKWKESELFKEILLQEATHIVKNEFGVLFRENNSEMEIAANKYALSRLRNKTGIA